MQDKLFNIKPIRVSRPTSQTIDTTPVYIHMAKLLNEWNNQDLNQEEFEDFIADLKNNFSVYDLFHGDGYKIARSLEKNMYFESDRELVDEMDVIPHKFSECLCEEVKKWVIDCEITPKYEVGDEVKVIIRNVEYIGEISKIYERTAEYSIFIEELGHVREGVGITGTIKKFEEIEKDFFDDKHWK